MFYIPLLVSFFFSIISYFLSRHSRSSESFIKYPKKYLLDNNALKKYFSFPKYPLAKHFVYWHFFMILVLLIIVILYAIYFYNEATQYILSNELFLIVYMISIGIPLVLNFTFDAMLYSRYVLENK